MKLFGSGGSDSGGALLLSAPAEQTLYAEAGGEEGKSRQNGSDKRSQVCYRRKVARQIRASDKAVPGPRTVREIFNDVACIVDALGSGSICPREVEYMLLTN